MGGNVKKHNKITQIQKRINTFNVLLNEVNVPNGKANQYIISDKITCMIHGSGIVSDIKTK